MDETLSGGPRFRVLDVVTVADCEWAQRYGLVGQRLVVTQVELHSDDRYVYGTDGHDGIGAVGESDLEPTGEAVEIEHFGTVPGGFRARDAVGVAPSYGDPDVAGHEAVVKHDWIVDGRRTLVSVWVAATETSAYVDAEALTPTGRRVDPAPLPRWLPALDADLNEIEGAGYLLVDDVDRLL